MQENGLWQKYYRHVHQTHHYVFNDSKGKVQSQASYASSVCIYLTKSLSMAPTSRSMTKNTCLFVIIVFFFDFCKCKPNENGSTCWWDTWVAKHVVFVTLINILILRCKPLYPIWLCWKKSYSELECSMTQWIDLGGLT